MYDKGSNKYNTVLNMESYLGSVHLSIIFDVYIFLLKRLHIFSSSCT